MNISRFVRTSFLIALAVVVIGGGMYFNVYKIPLDTMREPVVEQPVAATSVPAVMPSNNTAAIKQDTSTQGNLDHEADATDITLFTIPNFGISLYAPKVLHEASPRTNDCVDFSDSNNTPWFSICVKKVPIYSETGYWGNSVSFFFDQNKNAWMMSQQGTGADDPGGVATVATTTATKNGETISAQPIFTGTSQHSFTSRIVPIGPTTFLVINDDYFGNDYPPNSFIDRITQSISYGPAVSQAIASQAFRNVEDAYAKISR